MGKLGRMRMSHMIADTHAELMAMQRKIGVRAVHLQDAGSPREHFDICKQKRDLAVEAGAIEITMRQLAQITRDKAGKKAA